VAELALNGQHIEVDIREELEEFEWRNATWTANKLIACSPFRDDNRPSFYCFLEDDLRTDAKAGFWGDSGGSGEYEKGGFITLLSFLREETSEDTVEYLLDKYGTSDSSKFQFKKLRLKQDTIKKATLPHSLIKNLEPHDYLANRGIPKNIQRALKVGYDKQKKAIAFPWLLPNGELANIKYRKTTSKRFFYTKGGWSISKLLFGIQIFHQKDYLDMAVITEAEIDSLSCIVAGFPSLAVGGSKWSDHKKEMILGTNIKRVVIASDNDEAGRNLKQNITESLNGHVQILHVTFPADCKDCNDVLVKYGKSGLKQMIEQAKVGRPRFDLKLK
jgi:hypothetical protein